MKKQTKNKLLKLGKLIEHSFLEVVVGGVVVFALVLGGAFVGYKVAKTEDKEAIENSNLLVRSIKEMGQRVVDPGMEECQLIPVAINSVKVENVSVNICKSNPLPHP